ncbi:hypothetical protein FBZ84_1324 [Azospirillum baldaniorum]|nr:hypothetical protein FBZ84_1324 [Azospirillum baldaniorum]
MPIGYWSFRIKADGEHSGAILLVALAVHCVNRERHVTNIDRSTAPPKGDDFRRLSHASGIQCHWRMSATKSNDQCWFRAGFQNPLSRLATMKMAAAVSSARMIRPSLSCRRSKRLFASSHAQTMLDDASDLAERRAVGLADLADVRLDPVVQAEPAVVGTVVSRVRVEPADGGADDLGQAQQIRKEPGIMHVGGRRDDRQRQAVGRDDHMVLGPGLAAVGRVRPGQLAAPLGPHRATVHHEVPCGGVGAGARHADEDSMDTAQQCGRVLSGDTWDWSFRVFDTAGEIRWRLQA